VQKTLDVANTVTRKLSVDTALAVSFTSVKWAFVGSQPMLLALSKPAWIWAKTLSGSQHSAAGQLAGIGG
jgi:hypothetical protein